MPWTPPTASSNTPPPPERRRPPAPAHPLLAPAVAVIISLLFALGCTTAPSSPPSNPDPSTPLGASATIERVIDGDTVVVRIGGRVERVRLLGIDTPERPGSLRPAECHGDEATEATKALLPEGTEVLVTRDIEPRDRFGRLLAYLYRADDGLFVNLVLVEHGHAEVLVIEPNSAHRDLFVQAEARARAQGLGFWATCGGPDVPLE